MRAPHPDTDRVYFLVRKHLSRSQGGVRLARCAASRGVFYGIGDSAPGETVELAAQDIEEVKSRGAAASEARLSEKGQYSL